MKLRDRIADALKDQFTADEMIIVRRALSIILAVLIDPSASPKKVA